MIHPRLASATNVEVHDRCSNRSALIDTRGVGGELSAATFEQTPGQPMRQQAKIDGITEPVIFRETAELHGLATDRATSSASPAPWPTGIQAGLRTAWTRCCGPRRLRWHDHAGLVRSRPD